MNQQDHSSVVSASTASTYISLTLNPDFSMTLDNDTVSHAVIVIPPSSSDLSEPSTGTAPATLNINLNLVQYAVTEPIDEAALDKTNLLDPPSESIENTTNDENKSPPSPPKQLKRSASFAELAEKGVEFVEEDTFDRIRKASAGMEFQGKQNHRLRSEHRHSFGHMNGKVEWFHGGNKRPCPRGGWLTRMANGGGDISRSETGTPANGMYRTTNGFTFQC